MLCPTSPTLSHRRRACLHLELAYVLTELLNPIVHRQDPRRRQRRASSEYGLPTSTCTTTCPSAPRRQTRSGAAHMEGSSRERAMCQANPPPPTLERNRERDKEGDWGER